MIIWWVAKIAPHEFGLLEIKAEEHLLNENIKSIYEDLHNTLLYTNEKQNFNEAIKTLRVIDKILKEIEE